MNLAHVRQRRTQVLDEQIQHATTGDTIGGVARADVLQGAQKKSRLDARLHCLQHGIEARALGIHAHYLRRMQCGGDGPVAAKGEKGDGNRARVGEHIKAPPREVRHVSPS